MQKNIVKECKKHGQSSHVLQKTGYYRCQSCRSAHVTNWRKKVKLKLIEEFGGCCKLCGYHKCPEALHFHHLDPSQKEFSISQYGNTRRYEKCREEAKKCVILCCNCHTEVEIGTTQL